MTVSQIWGYHRNPYVLKARGLYSRRIDQRLRTYLVMEHHGPGKSHAPTAYDVLREPRYKIKWEKDWNENTEIDKQSIFKEIKLFFEKRSKMTVVEQPCYTLINTGQDLEPPSEMDLRVDLEKGNDKTKAEALKKVIQMMLSGDKFPSLLMIIIRYVMPSQDHTIKKLLLIFWEVVPKHSADGKLLHEMILVCDAYRKDLQHANEFIRGSTLRFLCKLKEQELLEPLMPSIRACLDYRHSYVRRNAVLAIFTIYKNFDFLIPDAPELIGKFLDVEQDMSCRRNAFMMLIHVDQERALNYLSNVIDQVQTFGDILQLVIVELIYKVCHSNPNERARFIRCIYNLLNSSSQAVRYEAAGTLITLSSAPTAVKAAASCYIDLIIKESDNNVKLIVLDRLIQLKDIQAHERILQELVMDILRVLQSPDIEVRRKTLQLSYDLVTSKTINEMILLLKKEVSKTHNAQEHEDIEKYKQLLVRTLHQCTMKFPDVAGTIIPVLIEFLADTNELAALDVLIFIREVIQRFSNLRDIIIQRLLDVSSQVKSVKILRATIWLLGEYCLTVEDIQNAMTFIRQSLGDLPIVDDEIRRSTGETRDDADTAMTANVQPLVTADGTYATQSAFVQSPSNTATSRSTTSDQRGGRTVPTLRSFLLDGDFFIGSALATSLCKLVIRYIDLESDQIKQNRFSAEAMFVIASILHLGRTGLPKKPMNEDDHDRMLMCVRILNERLPLAFHIFNEECRSSLAEMLTTKAQEEKDLEKNLLHGKTTSVQPDDPIRFSQLLTANEFDEKEDILDTMLKQAVGIIQKKDEDIFSSSKLNKVTQLTGFSDPVYAEAYVNVNQYDIVLDVLIVNQTSDTLQNLTLELATLGDLKLVEKPQSITMAPHDFTNIKANIKVTSTENGIIFGNIVYDCGGSQSDRNCVVLNDIHIDIMDYIVQASCNDNEFRQMWIEFEWENKIVVNTNIKDLHLYLQYLLKSTNMRCLTPEKALSGDCGFMAANLYAKSIFGEDVLANVSIEKSSVNVDAPVAGHIRIRAKSQGMALSMGDKINMTQKSGFKGLSTMSSLHK
ncbi:unnamed protein product [Didymodactylos carnosus]|uniref:Coatomer subunit beta n=1 Tax=Didymodactylos carnosus TaxID=1234261 RepID=A0A814VB64_9BILA|nr:unnamed protein product [Didymodactylos carnosus]CAF1186617.1 unnamed protein product [Didymodactylos carnosus]CAF3755791.1 unnamed protein product [Didymodactylos carnosus]CAF3950888.1 unnamed protein product [Didymodactylos carnosus]